MHYSLMTLFVSAFCLVASPLLGDESPEKTTDPSGRWHWEQDYGNGPVENWLVLKSDGDKLNGHYVRDETQHAITAGKIDDGKFSFKLTLQNPRNNKPIDVTCRGSVRGDELKGKSEVIFNGDSMEFEFKAARETQPSDVVGTWTLEIDAEGQHFTPQVLFTLKDDQLAATYKTASYGDFEAKEITIKKNQLTLKIFAEGDQGKLDLQYQGVPRGDAIAGTLAYEVGTASGTVDFTGKRSKTSDAAEAK